MNVSVCKREKERARGRKRNRERVSESERANRAAQTNLNNLPWMSEI